MEKRMWRKFWTLLATVVCWMLACPVISASSSVTVSFKGTLNYDEANAVLELVNQNRVKEGKQKLVLNRELQQAAMLRAEEQAIFYSHTRPDGTACYTAFPNGNGMRGENIAAGYLDAADVMNGWMNSTGHRENILNGEFNQIGIGCFEQTGIRYWTQLFSSEHNETGGESGIVQVTAKTDILLTNLELTVRPAALTLCEGQTEKLLVINTNKGWSCSTCLLSGNSFEWKASTEAADVKDGVVTGVCAGTSLITASLNGTEILRCPTVIDHVPGRAATCTEAQECEVCGEIIMPAIGHRPGAAATCTESQICTICGQLMEKALGHTGGTATCREKAVCVRCKKVYGEYADHTWGKWTTTEAATTVNPEKQTRQCTVCGREETRRVGEKLPEKTIPSNNDTGKQGTTGKDSETKPKLSMNRIILEVKRSTTGLKVLGLQSGNFLESVVPKSRRIVKISQIKKAGTFRLTGQKEGTTTLTIRLTNGESFQAVVQVKKIAPGTIRGIPKKISLKKGKVKMLKPKIVLSNAGQKIIFQSSDKKVATVSNKGKIRAKGKGKATITIKVGNKKVTCKVTVK